MAVDPIKLALGRRLRAARDRRKLSRRQLVLRLGVGAKTTQSWEMGRTFPEALALIPRLEGELAVSFAGLFSEAVAEYLSLRPGQSNGRPADA